MKVRNLPFRIFCSDLIVVPDLQHNSRYMSVSGFGDSVWDRASAAANTLKVNVTKAWTSTINASEEEGEYP